MKNLTEPLVDNAIDRMLPECKEEALAETATPIQTPINNRKSGALNKMRPLTRGDFTIGSKIGDGAYGTVIKVQF